MLGWTEQTIADAAGLSTKQVGNLVALHAHSTLEMKRLITEEKISANFAYDILKRSSSSEEAEKHVRRALKAAEERGSKRALPRHLEHIEEQDEGAGSNRLAASPRSRSAAARVKAKAAKVMSSDIKSLEAMIRSEAVVEVVDGFISMRMPRRSFAKLRMMAKMLQKGGTPT